MRLETAFTARWLRSRGMLRRVLNLFRQFPDLLPLFLNGLTQDDIGGGRVRR